MKKPSEAAKKAKAKELFTLSHKLLDAAKQLSEHHAAELHYNMQQAMEAAKTAAQKDVTKLQAMQKKAADDAAKRMSVYQKKVKAILQDIGNEAADGAEKHFDRARDAISDWIKEADKKIPMGGEKLDKSFVRCQTPVQKYLRKAVKPLPMRSSSQKRTSKVRQRRLAKPLNPRWLPRKERLLRN